MNEIIMKGRHVVISEILKTQALEQLYIYHMGTEKSRSWDVNQFIGLISMETLKSTLKLHYMSYVSADTTVGQDNTSWHPDKVMGGDRCRHVHSQQ